MSADHSGGSSAGTGQDASTGADKSQEIVFIKQRSPGLYDIFGLEENTEGQDPSFKLTQTQTADVAQSLPDGFLIEGLPDYLQSGPSRHVHFISSTGSGKGTAPIFYDSVLWPLLQNLGIRASFTEKAGSAALSEPNTINFLTTKDAESIRNFAGDLGFTGPDAVQHTIVLLSGDGGVIDTLNSVAEGSDTRANLPLIAILPLGTGNGLFHSLHKPVKPPAGSATTPSSLVQSLRTLFKGTAAPLPSFKTEFSTGSRIITGDVSEEFTKGHLYGLVVASYGFHSQLVWESDTPEYRKHGAKRFGILAEQLLRENHEYNASVEVAPGKDGSSSSSLRKLDRDRYAYILAAAVSNLEKEFTISPYSKPLDGKLRLVHFGPVTKEKMMEIMTAAYKGGAHVGLKWTGEDGKGGEEAVGYDEVEVVKVTTWEEDARWRKVCIDGTIVELPRGGSMTIKTESQPHLQVLVDRSIVR